MCSRHFVNSKGRILRFDEVPSLNLPCLSTRVVVLPLQRKDVLKQWVHKISRKNLQLNESTRVCSRHFVNSKGRILRFDEVPSLNLPCLSTCVVVLPPHRLLIRYEQRKTVGQSSQHIATEPDADHEDPEVKNIDVAVNTDLTTSDIEELEKQLQEAKKDLCEHEKQIFRVENISNDNSKVKYYTGFSTFSALMVCYNVLGPSVQQVELLVKWNF